MQKFISHKKSSYHNKSTHNTNTMARAISLSALCALISTTVGLTACQTTPFAQVGNGSGTLADAEKTSLINRQPELIKNTLIEAMQNQRRRSYAYHTSVVISNENRQNVLKNATPQQLAMADDPTEHCTHVHDEAYIKLMAQAEVQEIDVTDDKFNDEREAIKQTFLACDAEFKKWQAATDEYYDDYYNDYDEEGYEDDSYDDEGYEDSDSDDIINTDTEKSNAEIAEAMARLEAAQAELDEAEQAIYEEDSSEEAIEAATEYEEADEKSKPPVFLPDYDDEHTQLDVKKAKLIEAYLLKPLDISFQGIYQPRVGRFTILPILQYQTRNHVSAISQPIYFDARVGAIYLWADNFAYPMSEYLDNQLGSNWKNKWLKIELNDGTLPASFGRDVIKSYYAAYDTVLKNRSSSDYRVINPNELQTLTPMLSAKHLEKMQTPSTSIIISEELTTAQIETAQKQLIKIFYNDISSKYPELVLKQDEVEDLDADHDNLQQDLENDEALIDDNLDVQTDTQKTDSQNIESDTDELVDDDFVSNDDADKVIVIKERSIIRDISQPDEIDDDADADKTSDYDEASDNSSDDTAQESEEEAEEENEPPVMTSKLIVSQTLKFIKDYYIDEKFDEDDDVKTVIDNDSDNDGSTSIDYAKKQKFDGSSHASPDSLIKAQALYGLNNRSQIIWTFVRQHALDEEVSPAMNSITADVLTQYSPINSNTLAFPNLPANMQTPTDKNSVDVRAYIKDLIGRYEEGEGTEVGKMVFQMYQFYKLAAEISLQNSNTEYESDDDNISNDDNVSDDSDNDLTNTETHNDGSDINEINNQIDESLEEGMILIETTEDGGKIYQSIDNTVMVVE